MKELLKHKLALPAIATSGILLMILIVKLQPAMKHNPAAKSAQSVHYIEAKQYQVKPSIIGYGTVEPDVMLLAKAEVSGRIIYVHPALKKGAMIHNDTVLIKIDDKDYQLAHKQAEADLLANQASLQQAKLNVENTRLDLRLAEQKLKVAESEYKRKLKLKNSGSLSQSELDAQYQNVLALKQENQSLISRLSTLPADIKVIDAKIAISEAKVAQAQRDIERTLVKLDFNGRINKVYVEEGQFVSTGNQLFDASGFDKMLINAQFSLEDFRQLISGVDKAYFKLDSILDPEKASNFLTQAGLSATIESNQHGEIKWNAKVERISDDLDSQSRTVGVIVSVENNFKDLDPKSNPPLVKGMYLSVKLHTPKKSFYVIPRSALKANIIYTVSQEQTLLRKEVTPEYLIHDYAVIQNALVDNEKIITSDIFPAVEGMALNPVEDRALQIRINDFVGAQ